MDQAAGGDGGDRGGVTAVGHRQTRRGAGAGAEVSAAVGFGGGRGGEGDRLVGLGNGQGAAGSPAIGSAVDGGVNSVAAGPGGALHRVAERVGIAEDDGEAGGVRGRRGALCRTVVGPAQTGGVQGHRGRRLAHGQCPLDIGKGVIGGKEIPGGGRDRITP